MDGYGQRSYGGDRRFEIVSGKSLAAANQIYSTPDPPPVPARATRQSRTTSTPWSFSDPEMKRKKRIAKYKVYTVEGKFKASFKNGLRWIKNKCSEIIHGY
ncbi:hypothetical protein P3X46_003252 [Hevea brasiliensis]|uniref:DUF3511 domain-containing protein n=1 Tax=Hevea brasiliensis TaxID=3981 RepID=A0ABQ9N5N8_HEVBR|nr:uncharacterized protein LOC110659211 [Hevea brasiliensis]KAJ9187837.1 hypothetical protein P3X46_003252 [Hevea brasiliensis]